MTAPWFLYAVAAAVLYGLHQIFTKLAADKIGEGLGGFVVEATAALSILLYLAWLRLSGHWKQTSSAAGGWYSVLTGVAGFVFFIEPVAWTRVLGIVLALTGLFLLRSPAAK